MNKLNVTQVHLCHRCPRLLAYQLSGENGAWTVGLKGTGNFPGKLFHDLLAKPFHQYMCQGPQNKVRQAMEQLMEASPKDLEPGLLAVLDQHILEPVLVQQSGNLTTNQVTALAEGLSRWSANLADFLEEVRKAGKRVYLSEVFCLPEETIRADLKLSNGRTVRLTGKFDGLLLDTASRRAIIVEFKGLKPTHQDEDFIQVALYALLLDQANGIKPDGVVLYLEEDRSEARYSAKDLSRMSKNLLELILIADETKTRSSSKGKVQLAPPNDSNLCSICPFDSVCDNDWGPRITISPKEDINEADRLLQSLTNTLNAIKLPVEPDGYIMGPRLIRLKIKPLLEKGASVSKIMRRAKDLQIALSTQTAPLIQTAAGHMTVDVPRKITKPLTLGEIWEKGQANNPRHRAAFPLGMAVDGSIFWAKLSDATMTSILVAGTAGSGKSVFLRSAILGMARNAGPGHIRFTLIDPKLVSFTDFGILPHLAQPIIFEIEPAMKALSSLADEMEQRYELFAAEKVFDIEDYYRQGHNLSHHVIVIDEYADLMIDKTLKQEAEILIQRLCQKGRAAGFHVILSTQRPDAKVVTPLIKANLQLKVALKVTTSSNSIVVLDNQGAENLMGNGDMLVGGAVPLIRLQGPLATKTDLEAAMG